LSWKWVSRKHKRWGRKLIANTYFLINLDFLKVHFRKVKYSKFKNRKWVFHGIVKEKSVYHKDKPKIRYLVDVSNISQFLSSKLYILPQKYLGIYGYHSDYMKLVNHNTNVIFKVGGIHSSFKECFL